MRTTGSTAGNIIAAIIATQATRNATSDIVGCGSIGMPSMGVPSIDIVSAPMSPAVTADHHQPSPARLSNPACSQISRLPATLRTSLARTQPPSVVLTNYRTVGRLRRRFAYLRGQLDVV